MARERPGQREMLQTLLEDYKLPMLITRKKVGEILGISQDTLRSYIDNGKLRTQGKLIPAMALASFLCGEGH